MTHEAQANTIPALTPEPPAIADTKTPHPRLRLHPGFKSQFLPDDRSIIVYLPPGYEHAHARSYPVLYLHDGQNLFDPQTSFAGRTWQFREHADAAIDAREIEPLIIVGIYNTGDRRLAEYTHERDWQRGGGDAHRYGRLITEELMSWIAAHYRVRTDRFSTAIGGFIPIIPFFFAVGMPAVIASFAISTLAHFVVGASKSLVTTRSWWASGIEMTTVGILEAAITYGLGLAFAGRSL